MTRSMPRPNRQLTRRSALTTAFAGVLASPAIAAQQARLLDGRWARFGVAEAPDHGQWDAILARHLRLGRDGIARFDYAAVDPNALRGYLERLTATDPTALPRDAAFAYWVNLYNALTVHVVVGAWPVGSIREIGGSFLAPGPWREPLVTVAGRRLSLDEIEHGILRPVWRDPRVHYAVNCASLGCPNLAPRAFASDRLEPMLDDAARAYINHPRGARVKAGRLEVSSIYRWFREDFGGTDAAVIAHLKSHADPPLSAQLDGISRIGSDSYDWRING